MNFQWLLYAVTFLFGLSSSKAQDANFKTQNDNSQRDGKVFFKSYSTRTAISLSFLTSTLPYTCFSLSATPAGLCSGRRRRQIIVPSDFTDSNLETSVDNFSSSLVVKDTEKNSRRNAKILFTLWSTTTSTITATSYVVNHSVTLSIILICTFANSVYNLC